MFDIQDNFRQVGSFFSPTSSSLITSKHCLFLPQQTSQNTLNPNGNNMVLASRVVQTQPSIVYSIICYYGNKSLVQSPESTVGNVCKYAVMSKQLFIPALARVSQYITSKHDLFLSDLPFWAKSFIMISKVWIIFWGKNNTSYFIQ